MLWRRNHTKMIWNQHLIHTLPQTIRDTYIFVDGIPYISNFDFYNITKCCTCINANLRKNNPNKRSLSEIVSCPYQGFFIHFGFSGYISYDKEGKVIPSICEDLQGINGETTWIITAIHKQRCYMTILAIVKQHHL